MSNTAPLPRPRRYAALILLACTAVLSNAAATESMLDLAVTNARLLDGTGEIMPGTGIGIRNGRITRVLSAGETPAAATVIDAAGKTLMPGLIDTHVHLCVSDMATDAASLAAYIDEVVTGNLASFLFHGVTTIRSMGDPEDAIIALRERLAAGDLKGTRLQVVGPGITMTNGHPAVTVYGSRPYLREQSAEETDAVESARKIVNRLADKGVDAIKVIYEGSDDPDTAAPNLVYLEAFGVGRIPRFSTQVLEALIETSHMRGLRAFVHTVDAEAAASALSLGADGLEHGLADEPVPASSAFIQAMRDRGVYYAATLQVYDAIAPAKLANAMPQLKRLAEAGVKVTVGTDTFGVQAAGERTLREMELMVKAGLDPAQVIQAATGNAAASLGLDDTLGSLAPGKTADIIIVDGDPLADISALRNLSVVIHNGGIVERGASINDAVAAEFKYR